MKSTQAAQPLLLIVDDEPAVLEALEAELLPRFGGLCRIESYQRPQDMLESLERWSAEGRSVALAIVDQRMPGITGVELLKRLRESARAPGASLGERAQRFSPAAATRTVLLTGYGGPEVAEAARTDGRADRYREKPWSGEELAKDVKDLLGDYWDAAQRETHPSYREFVTNVELRDLWSQVEPVHAPAPLPGAAAPETVEHPGLTEAARAALRAALPETGARPGDEALAAFLLGTASEEQRAEVRRAAFASTEFRRELIVLIGQSRRLSSFEARVAFDETIVPEWVSRLSRLEEGEKG
jgi:CheY-like chemotaxis protein